MSILDFFHKRDGDTPEHREAVERRRAEILKGIETASLAPSVRERLEASRDGKSCWVATLTPAELLIARSHGIRPIAAVSATCWLHYGYSWTKGHAQGWESALWRLRQEAKAAGANAVLDVKMRTIPLSVADSMDFTLVGTAVKIDGLPASEDPIVATVPALEFVKLLDADIVPTGIAIGAHYEWLTNWRASGGILQWMGNLECVPLSNLWETVRHQAHYELRQSTKQQGNGALAHVNFSQMFELEPLREGQPKRYLARHIVIATAVGLSSFRPLPHDFQMVVDICDGKTPLAGTKKHHQSYSSNEEEGGI